MFRAVGKLVTMTEIEEKLGGFIKFNGWLLLRDTGQVSRAAADRRAIAQQKLFRGRD